VGIPKRPHDMVNNIGKMTAKFPAIIHV
jgi:hypothetical protein